MSRCLALSIAGFLAVFGCACSGASPKAGAISLEDALSQVGAGLNKLYEIRKGHPTSGLVPAEVIVTFNIASKESEASKLYVELGAQVGDVVKLGKLGAEHGQEFEVVRGNSITLRFVSVLLSPTENTLLAKSPAEIKSILEALKDGPAALAAPPTTH